MPLLVYDDMAPEHYWIVYEIGDDDGMSAATCKHRYRNIGAALTHVFAKLRCASSDRDDPAVFYPHVYTANAHVYAFFERVGSAREDSVIGGSVLQSTRYDAPRTGWIIVRPGGDARDFVARGCEFDPLDQRVASALDSRHDSGHVIAPDVSSALTLALLQAAATNEHGTFSLVLDVQSVTKAGYFVDFAYRDNGDSHGCEIAESEL